MISTSQANPVEHFGLSKEQKEQLEYLNKFLKENIISEEDYIKQKQEIIDGTFKLEEEEDGNNYHLNLDDGISSDSSTDDHHHHHAAKPSSSNKQEEQATTTVAQQDPTSSNGDKEKMNQEKALDSTSTQQETNGSKTVGEEEPVAIPVGIPVQVEVEHDDSRNKERSSQVIGVASNNIDLKILDTKQFDIAKQYKENYGFELCDDERVSKDVKTLFEANKDFNEKKIQSQRKRWKAFVEKHNIGPNGFTTLEEYEQQRIFHFIEESNDFKKLVRKGIPMEYRAVMWYIMSGANYQYLTHMEVFENLREKALLIPKEERETDTNFRTICKDVDRTFPTHPFFNDESNKVALRNVLYLYSLHNPKVGYCQSMNFLAGIMLVVGMNVQQAFFTLDRIIDRYLPPDMFDASMNGVYSESFVLEKLCLDRIPKLTKYMTALDSNFFILFATSWFLCLYLNAFPVETSLRIWDCFIHEKYKILYRIGVAYLSLIEKDIYKAPHDFHKVFEIVKETSLKMFDCRHLIKKSFSIRNFSKKKILEYRELYKAEQAKKK